MPFFCGGGCGQARRSLAYPLIADVRIRIQLDQYSTTFSAGDLISGRVEVTLRRSGTFDHIRISLTGISSTYWTELRYHGNRSYIAQCGGSEAFYSIETSVLDEPNKRSTLPLNEMQSFPFQLQLGQELPPSTLDLDGCCSIRYSLCASLEGMEYDDDEEDDLYVRTQELFDLSESTPISIRPFVEIDPETPPVENSNQTTLECCAWLCIFGPVEVELSLPRRAFLPKEFLPVTVEISNFSKIGVDRITLKFLRLISLRDKAYGQCQKKMVLETTEVDAETPPGATSEHFFEHFRVPETRPSMRNCPMITIGYAVEAEISFRSRFAAKRLRVSCGVTIGTTARSAGRIRELPTLELPSINDNESPSPDREYTLNDVGECQLRPAEIENSLTTINSVD